MAADTIFALSSGAPPAAIGIIRISGPHAATTLTALSGLLPKARHAELCSLRDPAAGTLLDRALVLWFPGSRTATGEDLAELHVHGGRAVVAAVLSALGARPGLRQAEPGEFTRRALRNGRIDLAQAEGLADLLSAETEAQRRAAIYGVEGHLSSKVQGWRAELLAILAGVEAEIEFADDDETIGSSATVEDVARLLADINATLASPPAERIRDGVRVVIAGPPNAGKSSLLNALAGRMAALVSDTPGTTRDVIEAPVVLDGLPFLLCDTAGIRESSDTIERLGIAAAQERIERADLLLWLGDPTAAPEHAACINVAAKTDIRGEDPTADVQTSSHSGAGLDTLRALLHAHASSVLSIGEGISLGPRQREILNAASDELGRVARAGDYLMSAEHLRAALSELARVGHSDREEVLDAIFSRFCVGK